MGDILPRNKRQQVVLRSVISDVDVSLLTECGFIKKVATMK
jgi:hypothetical protein